MTNEYDTKIQFQIQLEIPIQIAIPAISPSPSEGGVGRILSDRFDKT